MAVVPGPTWVRCILYLLLVAAVATLCLRWFYPWITDLLEFDRAPLTSTG